MMQQVLLGQGGGGGLDVDDVFSTTLYTGNNAVHEINNGIDLSGDGGLVWIKQRTSFESHALVDSERAINSVLATTTKADPSTRDYFQSLDSDGFTLKAPADGDTRINSSSHNYVSWSFGKSSKFFDVIKYTGNGSSQNISHSLGTDVGLVIVKSLGIQKDWFVWHSAFTSGSNYVRLNKTNGKDSDPDLWNGTVPTSTQFTVGSNPATNENNNDFIAYLFAEDTPNVIKCGSYSGTGSSPLFVNTGFTPQFLLYKNISNSSEWYMIDSARGFASNDTDYILANQANAEANFSANGWSTSSNGFTVNKTGTEFNASGSDYAFVAIASGS